MRIPASVLIALPLLLTACGQANLLPKPKPVPKTNSITVEADFKTLEIPKHALGEGWERIGHSHSASPAFPPRGAFKGVGESQKLEVSFRAKSAGELSLVASEFATPEDAEAMLEIILITKPGTKFTESEVFGYHAYDSHSTNSKQTGTILALGNVLVSVFSDDPRGAEAQERLLRYFFKQMSVPIPKRD